MQVKKFEAPTIQEALENVKRELGPEAIILQTKKNKRGFGLLSKSSVEITAAVSERSLQKKQSIENKLTEAGKAVVKGLSAEKQADLIDKYTERNIKAAQRTQDRVEVGTPGKKITATRYIDIEDDEPKVQIQPKAQPKPQRFEDVTRTEAVSAQKERKSDFSLEAELKNLKKLVEELKVSSESKASSPPFVGNSPLLQEAFDQLVLQGVDRKYAYMLIKKVAFELGEKLERLNNPDPIFDCLAHEIMESAEVQPVLSGDLNSPVVIALVGSTGVGKSTTIAKLASQAQSQRKAKVGLINLDEVKPGAFDQLATYARILNVPFRSASSISDFKMALADFRNCDVIFVDTSGSSQKDVTSYERVHEILRSVSDIRIYVVLSAVTRDVELYETVNRFSSLRPQGLILSKLDEASIYGSIYNVSHKTKLPLAYFTTGQRIPEDIEEATKERLVSLVMNL